MSIFNLQEGFDLVLKPAKEGYLALLNFYTHNLPYITLHKTIIHAETLDEAKYKSFDIPKMCLDSRYKSIQNQQKRLTK